MAKIQSPPRIRSEDFPAEFKEVAEKLAGVYNNFSNEVFRTINGQIDYQNLSRQVLDLDVTINSSGKVVGNPNIKYTLPTKLQGVNVLNARSLGNTNVYPTAHPFVSWSLNGQFIIVDNIAGLPANSQFRLTIELISI